jgi:hypothetical protein
MRSYFIATIAAAQVNLISALSSRIPAVANAKTVVLPQQQIAPLFPPLSRIRGCASRASCRAIAFSGAQTAALLVFPAAHFGGNFASEKFYDAFRSLLIF